MVPFGLIGWSGSGKTRLIEGLIPELTKQGISVSTIKHTHHDIDLDKPGKDSYRHRHAGARETLLTGEKRWTLIHEKRGTEEESLADLLAHMSAVDLVLVEGFKADPIPKIEVHRPALGKPLLGDADPHLMAVASDAEPDGLTVPCLDLNDVPAIAAFILSHMKGDAQ